MKKNYILEVCADSVESAVAAQEGGADRIELCANLIIGGTTPTVSLFREVKKHTTIPVHVLIRPRFGDFLYSDYEYGQIKEDIRIFKELGADAVVIGCLKADGTLDMERMKEMVTLARPMKVTLHRAFDVCRDPWEALEQSISLGIDTILTSGQESSSLKGKELLKHLQEKAGDRIEILAGAGISAEVIRILIRETDLTSFHMSGKAVLDSNMSYRKEDVPMGLPGFSEFEVWRTDVKKISEAAGIFGCKNT
ncbi:MAG: copper homeostasis protein CutC [Lachnospiraceae bacterium]